MDLAKSLEYFDPSSVQERIHIIGCGAVGSTVAEMLARTGLTKFTLWDFDTVCPHNIANQVFTSSQINKKKVEALRDIMADINPEAVISLKQEGWQPGAVLNGYVVLCIDNIDTTRAVTESLMRNENVKGVFNFRMGLTEGQHYAANWHNLRDRNNLLSTMQFSHEEAKEATPVSACNLELSFVTTVRLLCSVGVDNMISLMKGGNMNRITIVHTNPCSIEVL